MPLPLPPTPPPPPAVPPGVSPKQGRKVDRSSCEPIARRPAQRVRGGGGGGGGGRHSFIFFPGGRVTTLRHPEKQRTRQGRRGHGKRPPAPAYVHLRRHGDTLCRHTPAPLPCPGCLALTFCLLVREFVVHPVGGVAVTCSNK